VRISRQGVDIFPEQIEKRIDPRQRAYYWQGGEPDMEFEHPDVDGAALKEKYITVTPIKCDMTDYRMIEELKQWKLDKP
jgi:5'-nucleotidase